MIPLRRTDSKMQNKKNPKQQNPPTQKIDLFINVNKKAQLGRIIVSFPVLILIIILMAIFIFLASIFAGLKAPGEQEVSLLKPIEKDLLLQEIELSISENPPQKILILDAYALFDENKIEEEALKNQLLSLLNEENNCIILAKGNSEDFLGNEKGGAVNDDFALELRNGKTLSHQRGFKPIFFSNYKKTNLVRNLKLTDNEKTIYISHYIGRCIN